MELKRRRELSRDMDRYLASRRRKRINFKSLFHLPLELKPKISSFKKEKPAKEESYYESHTPQIPKFRIWIEKLKNHLKKPSEKGYIDYQSLDSSNSVPLKESEPKSKPDYADFSSSKKSWFKALIDIFRPSKEPEHPYSAVDEVKVVLSEEKKETISKLKEDLKEISKITLKVLKNLPKEKIDSFKNTEDFDKFKTILRKHDMIK